MCVCSLINLADTPGTSFPPPPEAHSTTGNDVHACMHVHVQADHAYNMLNRKSIWQDYSYIYSMCSYKHLYTTSVIHFAALYHIAYPHMLQKGIYTFYVNTYNIISFSLECTNTLKS